MAATRTRAVTAEPDPAPAALDPAPPTVAPDEPWTPGPMERAAPGEPTRPDAALLKDVEVGAVRSALALTTWTANVAAGERVGANLAMTDGELDAIAPPLTNVINRNARLKAMFNMGQTGDTIKLALGAIGYGWRVAGEIAETNRQREANAVPTDEADA